MPATLTIPTTFTAVDKFSTVISNMTRNLGKFTNKAGTQFLRFNQKFNNFFKLGDIQKQLLSYASTAVLVGGIVSGVMFSGKSLIDYGDNVAKVHSILNQLTDKGFKPFQDQIDKVANKMQFSAVEVAASFQKIAELNIDLAKTPESLGAVSVAAITLSRAAGMELTPATESLVAIMAQFHLQGSDANRVINTLAAGLKYGSATIQDQTDAFKNWGTVAKSANLSIEQAVALTQTLGKYQLKGEEAGTALRGTIIRLQKAHLGYASGLFNVNDALADATKHYNHLGRARDKDNYLIKLFGIRQITAGRILLQNTALIADLTKRVTGSNQAFEQAAIRTDTVSGAWQRLTAQFINYITGNENVREGAVKLKNALRWVADNLDSIISYVITGVKWFAILKVGMWAVASAIKLFNIYQAASIAIGTAAAATTASQTLVVGGFGTAISGVTTELGAANVAATTFFATLSEFAVPAALVTLGGLAIWKTLRSGIKDQKYGDALLASSQEKFNTKTPTGLISPFQNQKEEIAYQAWWLKNANAGAKYNTLERSVFDKDHGSEYDLHDKFDFSALKKPAATQDSTVHIILHDPTGNIKDVKTKQGSGITVTVSPTSGPQGKL